MKLPRDRFTIVPSANGDSTPSPNGSNYTTASESGPVSLQQEHGGAAAVAPNKDLKAQQPQQVGWILDGWIEMLGHSIYIFSTKYPYLEPVVSSFSEQICLSATAESTASWRRL